MNSRILVLGANGLLGQKVLREASLQGYDVLALSKGDARYDPSIPRIQHVLGDASDADYILELVRSSSVSTIVNCAAYTAVDKAEEDRAEAYRANVEIPQILADISHENNVYLVHISTDFVYDGRSAEAWDETELEKPLSEYGITKYLGDNAILSKGIPAAILRTSFTYGVVHKNSRSSFVTWIASALKEKKNVPVFKDQFRQATWAEDLARACLSCVDKRSCGVYHVTGEPMRSVAEYAYEIARAFELDSSLIVPVASSTVNLAAERPQYSAMSLAKAKQELGYAPTSFEESLKTIRQQLLENTSHL